MVDLKNKVVVVTGASSGIGRATAQAFARRGSRVVLVARRADRLTALAERLAEEGATALPAPADVTDPAQVERVFSQTAEQFGPVQILINAAGSGLKRPIVEIEPAEWRAVIAANLDSVYLCSRQAMRQMIAHQVRGHILTVCSVAGLYGGPGYAAYCAAKHGVAGFMRSLRWEARKHRIRATTMYPARVNTEFFTDYTVKPQAREMLEPEDIADYLVALACRCPLRIAHVRLRNLGKRFINLFRSDTARRPPSSK